MSKPLTDSKLLWMEGPEGHAITRSAATEIRNLRAACRDCVAYCCECNGTGSNILCGDVPCKTCSAARDALAGGEGKDAEPR